VSKDCACVVVVGRRRSFGVSARPFFAIGRGDLADFCFVQSLPAFDERGKPLSPIVARARFDPQVVSEIVQMNSGGLAKGHLGRDFAVAIADALTVFFQKFREPCLRYAKM
jgi:hypothetical protein